MNLGVDLVTISRFKNKNKEFIERLLSEEELAEFNKLDNEESKELFLARSWAIKEAIFKADNSYFKFNKINLIKINNEWNFKNFKISISHENDLLIAFVIKE